MPNILYRYLFGPRPPDAEVLESRRAEILDAYERIVNECTTLCDGFIEDNVDDSIHSSKIEQGSVEVSATLKTGWSYFANDRSSSYDLEDLLTAIEAEIAAANKVLQDLEWLTTDATTVYLRETEQGQLKKYKSAVKSYRATCKAAKHQVEASTQVCEQISQTEERFERIRKRVHPHLTYQKYAVHPVLVEEINSLNEKMRATLNTAPTALLPKDIEDKLHQIKNRTEYFSNHIEDYQREYIQREFDTTVDHLTAQLSQLSIEAQESLNLDTAQTLESQIREIDEKISGLRDYPLTTHLSQSDLRRLDTIETQLSNVAYFVDEAIQQCQQISQVEERFERFNDQIQPYLTYDKPKVEPPLARLLRVLNEDVQELKADIDRSPVSYESRKVLNGIENRTEEYSNHLEGYRGEYITREFDETATRLAQQLTELAEDVEFSTILEHGPTLRTRLGGIQDEITDLRKFPLKEHLSKERRTQLDSFGEQASNIEQQIIEYQETARLNQSVPIWEERLAQLADRMEPYLAYEIYELDSSLADAVNTLYQEVTSQRENAVLSLISTENKNQFLQVEQRIEMFAEHLDGYQDEFTRRKFSSQKPLIEGLVTDLQQDIKQSKAQARPLTNESTYRSQITEVRRHINRLREYPLDAHLRHSQLAALRTLEQETDSAETYLDAKIQFDSHIRSVQHSVASLQKQAAPYLTYRAYLTRPARAQLETAWNTASGAIKRLRHHVAVDQLGDPDQTTFKQLTQSVSDIQDCLDGYNDAFVQREQDRHKDLFSNIGPNELDLTAEQQRAVIRNGIYNQVIAGAGAGKTLVLTTRVAYLIRKQNVDPTEILVIAYTTEARDEMAARLENEFGITDVEVQNIHSFGNQLIQSTRHGQAGIANDQTMQNRIDNEIKRARDGHADTFLQHYYQFLLYLDDVTPTETDFETKKEYVKARAEQEYETLRGEDVKSRAEKFIADFLFTHHVEYRYENIAAWADTATDKTEYEPDFYLPNHDMYIEHWGLDTAGAVAPWFSQSTDEYHDKMRWGRDQFDTTDAKLIETYDFEHEAGWLHKALRHRLTESGVTLNQMDFEELVNSTFEYNKREKWIKDRFSDFIQNAKQFDVKPATIEENLYQGNQRQYHFAKCGIHLIKQYHRFLVENDMIDYADMVQDAAEIINSPSASPATEYDHLLVDEFQDIGHGKIEIIQGLTGPNDANLFAVGDDWQSIFSFQGAVVEYFINFAEHFGDPVQTILNTNFRSPEQIVAASNHLISHNDTQINKTLTANITRETTPRVHTLRGSSFYDYVDRVTKHTVALIQQYLANGAAPDDIIVLCRYDGAVPYLTDIKNALRDHEIPYVGADDSDQYYGPNGTADDGVSVYSLYQAKGREAKHVILAHAAEGPFGFPPGTRDNELLDPVQPFDMNTIAEERRAFYVALTRAEHTLDLLTRHDQESRFLTEISEYTATVNQSTAVEPLDDVGTTMSITAKVTRLFDAWEKQHQAGVLEDQYGGSARFVSWESDNPPGLAHGEWYRFDGVRVSEFNEQKEVVVSSHSTLTHIQNHETVINDIVKITDAKTSSDS